MTTVRFYLYLTVLIALVAGGFWLRYHWEHEGAAKVTISVRKQSAKVVAKVAKQDAKAQAAAAVVTTKGAQQVTANTTKTQIVVRTITRIVHDKPSPSVCVMDPQSHKALQGAADAANAAAKQL